MVYAIGLAGENGPAALGSSGGGFGHGEPGRGGFGHGRMGPADPEDLAGRLLPRVDAFRRHDRFS